MLNLIVNAGFELFHLICVITLASYFIIRTPIFQRVVLGKGSIRDRFLITLFFGALSIYGSISNIGFGGSQANVRDLGPVIAGLMFGPWIGIGAASIGAVFRFSLGGITVIPCTITTLLGGILAGIVWKLNNRRFIGTVRAIFFILFIEVIHLGLILLLAGDGPEVREILGNLWTTMLPLYIIGISVFSLVYANYVNEQKDREELERKQVELKSAHEIQNSFLPTHPPVIPGYDIHACAYPAREVGGDFYDYISFDDGRFGFVIADVSGKSVPAAIFMALSCTMVRVLARWIPQPNLAAEQVNSLITRYAESGMFFSMFYGVISPDHRVMEYVNAGHPPPVLLKQNGEVVELYRTGSIIGFLEHQIYKKAEIVLEEGDLLVCYSDGATEAKNSDGDMFGKSRLYEVIANSRSRSAERISGSIIDEINHFVGLEPQFDDTSLLIVKRAGPNISKSDLIE